MKRPLLASLACWACLAHPASWGASSYQGKYKDHQDFPKLEALIADTTPEALRAVRLALGLDASAEEMEISLEDVPPGRDHKITTATTTTVSRQGRAIQRIVLHPELYFGHLVSLRTELIHEITHAVMRAALGESHQALPTWVREGLAVWVAKQGEEKIAASFGQAFGRSESPDQWINGLEGRHAEQDYVEDYLAFAYLESLAGHAGIRQFVGLLREGRSYQEALAEVTGDTWEAFQVRAQAFALDFLRRHQTAAPVSYVQACRSYQKGKFQHALPLFESCVKSLSIQPSADFEGSVTENRSGKAPVYASALYYQARCLQRLDHVHEAEQLFERLLSVEHGPWLGGLIDEAAFYYAEAARQQGLLQEAVERYQRMVRDYPYSSLIPEALFRWSEALVKLGDREAVSAPRAALKQYYPSSSWAAKAGVSLPPSAKSPRRPVAGAADADAHDVDHDSLYYAPKTLKHDGRFRRIQEAAKEKLWEDVAAELNQLLSEGGQGFAVEISPDRWLGLSAWMVSVVDQMPAAMQKDLRADWELMAKKFMKSGDGVSWEALKELFALPGDLTVKQSALARSGLESFDSGDLAWGKGLLGESRLPALQPLGQWLGRTGSAAGPQPPLSKRWTWKTSGRLIRDVALTANRVWMILDDGSLAGVPYDAPHAGGGVAPTPGITTMLLPESQLMVRFNMNNPLAPVTFGDLARLERWNVSLPKDGDAEDRQSGRAQSQRVGAQFFIAGASSADRLYVLRRQPAVLNQQFDLSFWPVRQPAWQWTRDLVNIPAKAQELWQGRGETRSLGPITVKEAGSQWVALSAPYLLMAGNLFTGDVDWVWAMPASAEPAPSPLGQPAVKSMGEASPVIEVKGDTIVCSLPAQRVVYALDRRTGRLKWQKTNKSEDGDPMVLGVYGSNVVIASVKSVGSYALEDGTPTWETQPVDPSARRQGIGVLAGHQLYLPWGSTITVLDAATGKSVGSVQRSIVQPCTLWIGEKGLVEIADQHMVLWQASQEEDRLTALWKEQKDVNALLKLAQINWENNHPETALAQLTTWFLEAPATHPERTASLALLSDWMKKTIATMRETPVWLAAWDAGLAAHQVTPVPLGVWELARSLEGSAHTARAIAAYQRLLQLAAVTPVLTTVEGSTFNISLVAARNLNRLQQPGASAASTLRWVSPPELAWTFVPTKPTYKFIPTPTGVLLLHENRECTLIRQDDASVAWTEDFGKSKAGRQRVGGAIQDVVATPHYLAMHLPEGRLVLVDPTTGKEFKQYSLPYAYREGSRLIAMPDGLAVIQEAPHPVKPGTSVNVAILLNAKGETLMKGEAPVTLTLGQLSSSNPLAQFQSLVSQGPRVFLINIEGGKVDVECYQTHTWTQEWKNALTLQPQQLVVGLRAVDDHTLALATSTALFFFDTVSGKLLRSLPLAAGTQVLDIQPNRILTHLPIAQSVTGLDIQGEVLWSQPGTPRVVSESAIGLNAGDGSMALHDAYSGELIGKLQTSWNETIFLRDRPQGVYQFTRDRQPKATWYTPAKK